MSTDFSVYLCQTFLHQRRRDKDLSIKKNRTIESIKNLLVRINAYRQRRPKTFWGTLVLLMAWLFCLPRPLFDAPLSAVLEDRNGDLLGAHIASDGQWRFPMPDSLPDKYIRCVVAFEDKRFWMHPGVDPIGLCRATYMNLRRTKVVSGGSTLTMQVIRLSRNNPPRTIWEKLLEAFMATRLELTHSKKEILRLYATHAPFGGNVVGLEAASWRFYGKKPQLISWAEAATLAVLPNSPALIHPGRNRATLLEKRNRLLKRLYEDGTLEQYAYESACEEPLPEAPLPLPQLAPHLLDRFCGTQPTKGRFGSSIDRHLQERLNDILTRRHDIYKGNEVHNMAAVILDVPTGEVLAYVGNVPGAGKAHGESVDVVVAPRSTGSILKPYLYAFALESGDILPQSLLHDVPTQMGQYHPENYYETYDGAVPAKRALVRSLNVPFVLLLHRYGLETFHLNLRRLGLSTLQKPPEHYGLSLILGGAEAKLLDITNAYACMGRTLGAFYDRNGQYAQDDFRPPTFSLRESLARSRPKLSKTPALLSAASIWYAFEAMREVERPNSSGDWELFQAGQPVAWKTGTSFGFRDAWAAGVTPRYAVGVWVGNADGEGRPGLLGVEAAAPVLFEVLDQLPQASRWFDPPYDDMSQALVCRQSGFRAGEYCESDTLWIPKSGLRSGTCPYHVLLHLDASGQHQVNSDCEAVANMQHRPWFVLPPTEEYYYKSKNPAYLSPPPFRADCLGADAALRDVPMQIIYPRHAARLYIPVELNGKRGSVVFQVAHRSPETEVFWHLDGQYLGSTKTFHQLPLQPDVGQHRLSLVDKAGHRVERVFEVVGKSE
jgi:penicillin-binding protein 1C